MVRCKFGDEPDRFLHLPDAGRRLCRELPAVLLVFILEKAGADAERQSSPADQIDARRDLGEMRGIAITDRRAKGGETNTGRIGSVEPRRMNAELHGSIGSRSVIVTAHAASIGPHPSAKITHHADRSPRPCFGSIISPRAFRRVGGKCGRAAARTRREHLAGNSGAPGCPRICIRRS